MIPLTCMLSVLKGVGGRGGGGASEIQRKSQKNKQKDKGIWCKVIHRTGVFFICLWNTTTESASLIVCGRAFQSLGAELEKARKPNCFLVLAKILQVDLCLTSVCSSH